MPLYHLVLSLFEVEDEERAGSVEGNEDRQGGRLGSQSAQLAISNECFDADEIREEWDVLNFLQELLLADRSSHAR